MRIGQALSSVVSRTTFLRAVYLVIGGVILSPYLILAAGFGQMFRDPTTPVVPVGLLATITLVTGTVPPLLSATRALEVVAARALLGVDLPDPEPHPSSATRMRGAAWYVLHLVSGGLATAALMFAVPMAVLIVAREVGGASGTWVTLNGGALLGVDGWWAIPVALGLVLVAIGVVAGLGMAMASVAPVLLGPSEEERLQALEAEAERLTERNRLARELHDSVGHALTVTTVQASAALRVFDTDPEFAKRAISAVEETGRAAMEDLDHMLRVLRADDETPRGTAPQRTLADLDRLLDEARATGIVVESSVAGEVGGIPAVVSREAYRIVQEGLTNAVRHAKSESVTVDVHVDEGAIEVDITNPLPAPGHSGVGAPPRGGRGLRGMRERVGALGGTLSAGPRDGVWVVRAHVPASPVPERRRRS